MGKVKHRRLRISRYSPTHVPFKSRSKETSKSDFTDHSVTENKEPEEGGCLSPNHAFLKNGATTSDFTFSGKGGLKKARAMISSNVVEERVTGLNMLAAFALESKASEAIIESNMITSIAQLLKDQSSQVRLAAAGALRNICSWGSDEFIDLIVQQDIMQPLVELLNSYHENVPSVETKKELSSLAFSKGVANTMEETDPLDLIFIHAVNVLWSLCECNEDAVLIFNRENLVTTLLRHVNPFVWSFPISLAAADCLLCISENNPKVVEAVLPLGQTLMSLVHKSLNGNGDDAFGLHYAVVISGILLNVNYWVPEDTNFRQVYEVLSKVIEIDALALLNSRHSEPEPKQKIQERFEHIVSAQLIAFEILSNICCPDDEDDDEFQEYEETFEEQDMSSDEPMDLESGAKENINSLPIEVLEGIKYFQLVSKTKNKIIEPSIKEFIKNEDDVKGIGERMKQLQIRALQCLQNLITCLHVEDLGGPENLYSTWVHFGQLSFSDPNMDKNLLEALSGAMRVIIEKLSEIKYLQLIKITSDDLQPIFSSILSCDAAAVKANLCRMIGTLGCFAIKQSTEENFLSVEHTCLLTAIADNLCKVSQRDDSLFVRAESLDVLIDLFSDDKTDKMAAQIRLVERLRDIHPQFKAKFHQQRKKLGDHRALVLTVRDNLTAFIKYKGSRTTKFSKLGC